MRLARSLELNVLGICFHVGSGCGELAAYGRSIAATYKLFELGRNLGFSMELLDIGGGYPGYKGSCINEVSKKKKIYVLFRIEISDLLK